MPLEKKKKNVKTAWRVSNLIDVTKHTFATRRQIDFSLFADDSVTIAPRVRRVSAVVARTPRTRRWRTRVR